MRPRSNITRRSQLSLLLFLLLFGNAARLSAAPLPPADMPDAAAAALIRSGHDSYYNTNYEAAIRDFEKVAQARPDDAAAVNRVMEAYLFRELYHAGALNTTMYSGDSFTSQKRPVDISPAARAKILELIEQALKISEARLQKNSNDIEGLYNRGVTRSLKAVYEGIVLKAWFAALRSAIGARSDHQRVLELKPDDTDAKTVVGVHNYVAGSLPWAIKAMISVVGLSGSRSKGLEYLRAAAYSNSGTSVDARVALALFLRREQRYGEAMDVVKTLTAAYPHNYLFALEQANILKDWGKNEEALDAYRKLLRDNDARNFFEPRMEFANYDLAEILRGRGEYKEAVTYYDAAVETQRASPELRQKAALGAGEMNDLLGQRDLALKDYQIASNAYPESELASTARELMKTPYKDKKKKP